MATTALIASPRLRRALSEMVFVGIDTTVPLFMDLVDDPNFQKGEYHIHWLEEWLAAK